MDDQSFKDLFCLVPVSCAIFRDYPVLNESKVTCGHIWPTLGARNNIAMALQAQHRLINSAFQVCFVTMTKLLQFPSYLVSRKPQLLLLCTPRLIFESKAMERYDLVHPWGSSGHLQTLAWKVPFYVTAVCSSLQNASALARVIVFISSSPMCMSST